MEPIKLSVIQYPKRKTIKQKQARLERKRKNAKQIEILEWYFKFYKYVADNQLEWLSNKTNLTKWQIRCWLVNKRQKESCINRKRYYLHYN